MVDSADYKSVLQAIPAALKEAIVPRAAPLGTARIRQAIARLETLPAFYPTAQQALRLLSDPRTTADQIQQVSYGDPVLAGRVLRWADAAQPGFSHDVYNLSMAVTRIGREKFAALLYRFLAGELLSTVSGGRPEAAAIRKLAAVTAVAAHSVAERLRRSDQEEILLAGWLHNAGEILLLSQFREVYETMQRAAAAVSRAEAEKSSFGAGSSVVGKWLLEAWRFPPFYPAIVEHWPDPWAAPLPAPLRTAAAVVHAARRLAEAWVNGLKPAEVPLSFSPRLWSTLEIDRQFLTDLYVQLPAEIERSKGALA